MENKILGKLEKLDERLDKVDVHLGIYNQQLKDHIRRTEILEDLHNDNQKRIELLEEPKKARDYVKNVAIDLGKLIGVVLTIITLIKYLK